MISPSLNYNEETPLTQRINNLAPPVTIKQHKSTMQPTKTHEATVRQAAEGVFDYLKPTINADDYQYKPWSPPR